MYTIKSLKSHVLTFQVVNNCVVRDCVTVREQNNALINGARVEDISKANFITCPTCCAYTVDPDHTCPPKGDSIKIVSFGSIIGRVQKNMRTARISIVDAPHVFEYDTITSDKDYENYEIGQMVSIYGWVREDSNEFAIIVKNPRHMNLY